MSQRLIQSYVKDKYFVSTIYRESSAAIIPSIWYFETMVWEWNPKTRERGKWLAQEGEFLHERLGLEEHFRICSEYAAKEPELDRDR